MTDSDIVFNITTSANLFDKMNADYLHPERVNTISHLKNLEKQGIIDLKKLDEIVEVNKKKIKSRNNRDFICIEMSDIDVDYGLFTPKYTNIEDAGSSIIECNSDNILFSRIRPYLNKITLLPSDINKALCSGEFFVLSPLNTHQEMGYLWIILRSEFILHQSRHLSGGSLRPRLEQEDIGELQIPIIKDDKKRQKINSLVTGILIQYYSSLEKYRGFEQKFLEIIKLPNAPKLPDLFFMIAKQPSDSPQPFFRMDPLFFHPYYFELLKKELYLWSELTGGLVHELKDLCVPNGVIKPKIPIKGKAGIIPRISGECITGNGVSWDCDFVTPPKDCKFMLQKNDILITSIGTGSAGRIDIYQEDFPSITDGEIIIIRLKPQINPFFIFAYLKTEYGKRQLTRMERGSSGQIHLYPDDIQKLLVPIPKQQKTINKAIVTFEAAYNDIHACKQTLRTVHLQLSQALSSDEIMDEYCGYNTTIPIANWRIKRPSKA